jgi:hypothetical protein
VCGMSRSLGDAWPEERVSDLRDRWARERPQTIADAFGMSKSAIIGMAYRLGLGPAVNGRRYAVSRPQLEKWRAQGEGAETIAARFGCQPSTVRFWLRSFGMPTTLPLIEAKDSVTQLNSKDVA